MAQWAKAMVWMTADLTEAVQPFCSGIAEDDGLADIGRLQETFRGWLLEAYHKPPPFHGFGPT